MSDIHADKVLILDFGAQYTQLIARRIREIGVYSEIYACDATVERHRALRTQGHCSVGRTGIGLRRERSEAPRGIFSLGIPVLGICYGMQAMAAQLGGQV